MIKFFIFVTIIVTIGTASFAGFAKINYGVDVFASAEKQCINPDVQIAIDKGLVPQFDYNLCK